MSIKKLAQGSDYVLSRTVPSKINWNEDIKRSGTGEFLEDMHKDFSFIWLVSEKESNPPIKPTQYPFT